MLNITLFAIFILRISKLSATTDQEITTSAELETTPVCRKIISSKERKVLCQTDTLQIDCPDGTVVTFIDANFGRSSREPCHEFWALENKNCRTNSHTLAVLRKRCSNTTSCRVLVSKDVFGSLDVCYKITKYLDVTYACEKEICQGQDEISADLITRILSYNITRPDINTTASVNTRVDKDIVDNNTNDSMETTRKVLTIIGSVLGVVLSIVIFTVLCYMAKQKRVCKMCRTKTPAQLSATYDVLLAQRNQVGHDYADITEEEIRQNNDQREMYENSAENNRQNTDIDSHDIYESIEEQEN